MILRPGRVLVAGHQRVERPQAEIGALRGALDAGVAAQEFETDLVLVEGGAEGVAVGGGWP